MFAISLTNFHLLSGTRKAFSLNAIVDVSCRRRRRHEMIFLNISETSRASDYNIYHKMALDILNISTGNDVKTTSGRKQIVQTCKGLVMFGSQFLSNGSTDSENVYSSGNHDSRALFIVV